MWNATFESKSNLSQMFDYDTANVVFNLTVEFDWFKRRTSHAFNSRIKFGTREIRRLNPA